MNNLIRIKLVLSIIAVTCALYFITSDNLIKAKTWQLGSGFLYDSTINNQSILKKKQIFSNDPGGFREQPGYSRPYNPLSDRFYSREPLGPRKYY